MLDIKFYSWLEDAETHDPLVMYLSELDFNKMPLSWAADTQNEIIRYNGHLGEHRRISICIHHILVAKLCEYLFDSSTLVNAALWHDFAEVFTGDIVSPVKELIDTAELKETERYVYLQLVKAGYLMPISETEQEQLSLCDKAIRDVERGFVDKTDTACQRAKAKLCKMVEEDAWLYAHHRIRCSLGRLLCYTNPKKEWLRLALEHKWMNCIGDNDDKAV